MGNKNINPNKKVIESKKIYKKLYIKIHDYRVFDSEIIQEIESTKYRNIGFDINWNSNDYEYSILMFAVLANREELVRYLLTIPDININYKTPNDVTVTALYIVCIHTYNINIFKLLLTRRDLDVNIQDNYGRTGLHYACYNNSIECARELLFDARVNIMIHSKWRKTARDFAIYYGHPRIANIIKRVQYTSLLRIPNSMLIHDIIRMIIEEYT